MKKDLNKNIQITVDKKIDKAVIGKTSDNQIPCYLHWKECSYDERIENLNKFKKGDVLTVKLKEIDGNKVKVSLREANEKDPWNFFKENNKSVGDIITTRVIEVLKTGGIKVAADPDKKIITSIKKSDLAKDVSNHRSDIFSGGEKLDTMIMELNYDKRIIRLSPKEAQIKEEKGLIAKFGKNASTSGQKLASIFKTALGKKDKKEK